MTEPRGPAYAVIEANSSSHTTASRVGSSEDSASLLVIDILFMLLIICGNLVIMFTILSKRRLNSQSSMMFMVSIAAAHLLIGFIVMPLFLVHDHPAIKMTSGSCKLASYFKVVGLTATPFTALVATFDQFFEHMGRREKPLRNDVVVLQIIAVWVFSCLYAVRALFLFDVVTEKKTVGEGGRVTEVTICETPDADQATADIFLLIDTVVRFAVPILIALLLHLRVFRHVWWSNRHVITPREKKVLTVTILIVIFAELISELPEIIVKIYVYWIGGFFENALLVIAVVETLSFVQGWLNVILIIVFNEHFRAALLCRPPPASDEDRKEEFLAIGRELHPMVASVEAEHIPTNDNDGSVPLVSTVNYESAV